MKPDSVYRRISFMRFCFIGIVLLVLKPAVCLAQIDFKQYFPYTPTITHFNPGSDLDFGTVTSNMGQVSISINNAKIMVITGIKSLNVYLDVFSDTELSRINTTGCTPSPDNCTFDFDLMAAYANLGQQDISGARTINLDANNSGYTRFRILGRSNSPPGPPPDPFTADYNPAVHEESAYIYLYGNATVGNILPGTYEATITLTVSYD